MPLTIIFLLINESTMLLTLVILTNTINFPPEIQIGHFMHINFDSNKLYVIAGLLITDADILALHGRLHPQFDKECSMHKMLIRDILWCSQVSIVYNFGTSLSLLNLEMALFWYIMEVINTEVMVKKGTALNKEINKVKGCQGCGSTVCSLKSDVF